ncbi:MAG: M20 family metallopeptidase [Pyrinomonadaceae bacterium]
MTAWIQTSLLTELSELIASRRDAMLALTRKLVEAESPSGDVEGSRFVVKLLIEAAAEIPMLKSAERVTSPDYGEHLRRSYFEQSASARSQTLILGHTDTVHPRGTILERPWRSEGERIFGPGIFDMKANCALALEAIRARAALGGAHPTNGDAVTLLLTCDEEDGSATGRALVEEEARRAARVLVLEPSAPGGRAKTGRKGTGAWTLRAHGLAAHAGLDPEKGASAILEIARQIERLHALNDFSRGTTINVGVVRGGTTSNVIAAEAEAEIDVRYTTAAEAARLTAVLANLRPIDDRVQLTMEGAINRPPLERSAAVVELFNEARRIAHALGFELGEAQVGGASDGNFAASLCPAVLDGLGIEGDGAHARHEHIITTHIPARGAMIAALLSNSSAE